jgi:predicted esterase
MSTEEHHIRIEKQARVFTYGKQMETAETVWLVAHGYGYLAENFIKRFTDLDVNKHFVIAPEALNKFYLNGLSGKVGASWMTTEDRENEINDYIQYLDNIYITFNLQKAQKLVILGFSQGGATVARWFLNTQHIIKNLVFWGSSIPDEVLQSEKIHTANIFTLIGDEDEFVTKDTLDTIMKRYSNANLTFSHIFYKGGHKILTEPLLQLIDLLKLS